MLLLLSAVHAAADTHTWKASTTGDWFTAGNWMESAYPTNGDDVVITNAGASVLLTNSTAYLGSLTLSAPGLSTNTLVFSNWNTTLSATNVYIRTNATVTLPPAFTNGAMSNNVYIVCSNLTIDAGGRINADGCGYADGYQTGYGPGGARAYGCGAGHGGCGGGIYSTAIMPLNSGSGLPYGSTNAPMFPGSGGSASGYGPAGGKGGGAVRIEASGDISINGSITANGINGGGPNVHAGGGGSGGSIYFLCNTISGTGGMISVNGGAALTNGAPLAGNLGGGGGGGRIALNYNTNAQVIVPQIGILARPGSGFVSGDIGTIYLPNAQFIGQVITNLSGQIWGITSLSLNSLMISNMWIRFPAEGFVCSVTNDLVIDARGQLDIGGSMLNTYYSSLILSCVSSPPSLNVGGNVILTNASVLSLFAAMTNSGTANFGAYLGINGNVVINSNCWIYPASHPTNGGSVFMRMNNLFILGGTNGGISANAQGFAGGDRFNGAWGPGRGIGASGGGYGGPGGNANGAYSAVGGASYGSSNQPVAPGSGGGGSDNSNGSRAGGLAWLSVNRTVSLGGSIFANGANAGSNAGGGAGGGIFIFARTVIGAGGYVNANGGAGNTAGGGGGGGRVAIWTVSLKSPDQLAISVLGGTAAVPASYGTNGTVYIKYLPPPGTVFTGR